MKQHLLLLSGLLCDETVWGKIIPGLEHCAHVTPLDFRGLDAIEEMAKQVLRYAPDNFNLAGHSMGARVALEVFKQAPARVQRLALLNTGVHPAKPAEKESRQVLLDLARTQGMRAMSQRWLPPMVRPEHTVDPQVMEPLHRMVESMTPEIFAGQVHALLHRPDATAQLANIRIPTLVGVGRHDCWSPVEQHEFIVSHIAGAQLRIFENSGHMAPFEEASAVLEALLTWLQ
ncbi:alpha/beta hydrolase [Pseudomonas sp. App30]|uniref:alpha/beta fold hydrolase n=1 Tax=Pseudomonas sp. App30 TaxID=3068990 RepID=UPI003A80BDC0